MFKKTPRFIFAFVLVFTGLFASVFTNVANAANPVLVVSNISQTTADIKVTGLAAGKYDINIDKQGASYGGFTYETSSDSNGSISFTQEDLYPNTKYFASIEKVSNAQNQLVVSELIPFSTKKVESKNEKIEIVKNGSTSVDLIVKNLESKDYVYTIDCAPLSSKSKDYSCYKKISTSDFDGGTNNYSFSLKDLSPNTEYVVYLRKTFGTSEVDSIIADDYNFSTLTSTTSVISLTTSSLTATSVTLNATGLTSNIQNVVFTLASTTGGTGQTPSYNNSITVASSASGTASASFTGLSSGGSYSGSVTSSVDPLVTVDFSTTGGQIVTGEAPIITRISPTSGKVGGMVTITGKNLINVNWIVFSGAGNVPTTTNPSPTEITVRVPPGATSGPITVHTLNNGDASSESFTVTGTTNPGTCSNGATDYPTCTPPTTGTSGTIDMSVKGGGLVPDCPSTGCGFNELMKLINTVINFLLITLATPLFALILIYVGWLYLSAGGSSENVTQAKKIFKNVVIGYVIALAAWLIVKTILTTLGFTGDSFLG